MEQVLRDVCGWSDSEGTSLRMGKSIGSCPLRGPPALLSATDQPLIFNNGYSVRVIRYYAGIVDEMPMCGVDGAPLTFEQCCMCSTVCRYWEADQHGVW